MILGYILASFLDVHSSCLAIGEGRREILLPAKSCSSLSYYTIVSGSSVIIYDQLELKNKHKKLRRFIFFSAIAAHSLAATYNYKHLDGRTKR